MSSRPLQIAFTALTLSLIVSLSLWVVHASHEQLQMSEGVTLQMPTIPASTERDAEQATGLPPDPFAEPYSDPPTTEPPARIGLETAPVSNREHNPPWTESDRGEKSPVQTVEVPEEPLELPAIDLSEQATAKVTPLDEPVAKLVPPAEELEVAPLEAPEPPAWLSVQATLEAEIDKLRQHQQELNAALRKENQQAKQLQSQNSELSDSLTASLQEIKRLQASVENLRQETSSLKTDLNDKSGQLEKLETQLEENQQRLAARQKAEQDSQDEPIVAIEPNRLPEPKQTADNSDSLPIPPLPNENQTTEKNSAVNQELEKLYQNKSPSFEEAPPRTAELPTDEIVPELAGQTPPPFPDSRIADNSSPATKPLIPAEPTAPDSSSQRAERSPFYESAPSPQVEPVKKKRGLIYDLQDWFHSFHKSDSCTDCVPECVSDEICTEAECAVPQQCTIHEGCGPTEIAEPNCSCPRCADANHWIREDELLSYEATHHRSAPTERGLIPQMKRWWQNHKRERDVRYEPPIVGRPADAVVLPAAHAE